VRGGRSIEAGLAGDNGAPMTNWGREVQVPSQTDEILHCSLTERGAIMRWAGALLLGLAASTLLAAPIVRAQPGPRLQEGPFSEHFDGRVDQGEASRALEHLRTRHPSGQCAVTLDAFSGRPNPTWQLSKERSAKLFKRLQRLGPPSADAASPSRGLGYRGVVIECPTDPRFAPIRVFCGVVSMGNDPASPLAGYVDRLDRQLVLSAPRETRLLGLRALDKACGH
jgi:hypothetical protein